MYSYLCLFAQHDKNADVNCHHEDDAGEPLQGFVLFSGADKRTKRDIHLTRALPYMEGA